MHVCPQCRGVTVRGDERAWWGKGCVNGAGRGERNGAKHCARTASMISNGLGSPLDSGQQEVARRGARALNKDWLVGVVDGLAAGGRGGTEGRAVWRSQ